MGSVVLVRKRRGLQAIKENQNHFMDTIWKTLAQKESANATYAVCQHIENGRTISSVHKISAGPDPQPPMQPFEPDPPLDPLPPLKPLETPKQDEPDSKDTATKSDTRSQGSLPTKYFERHYFRSTYVDEDGQIVTTEESSGFSEDKP